MTIDKMLRVQQRWIQDSCKSFARAAKVLTPMAVKRRSRRFDQPRNIAVHVDEILWIQDYVR
jgi:hypothetical protein